MLVRWHHCKLRQFKESLLHFMLECFSMTCKLSITDHWNLHPIYNLINPILLCSHKSVKINKSANWNSRNSDAFPSSFDPVEGKKARKFNRMHERMKKKVKWSMKWTACAMNFFPVLFSLSAKSFDCEFFIRSQAIFYCSILSPPDLIALADDGRRAIKLNPQRTCTARGRSVRW